MDNQIYYNKKDKISTSKNKCTNNSNYKSITFSWNYVSEPALNRSTFREILSLEFAKVCEPNLNKRGGKLVFPYLLWTSLTYAS